MSLSGSFKEVFAVSPVMGSQCSQPVKFKMSQNGVPEMAQSGTFRMYPSGPPSVPLSAKIQDTLGKCWVHSKCSQFSSFPDISLQCSQSVLDFCRKWYTGVVLMGTSQMYHFGSFP